MPPFLCPPNSGVSFPHRLLYNGFAISTKLGTHIPQYLTVPRSSLTYLLPCGSGISRIAWIRLEGRVLLLLPSMQFPQISYLIRAHSGLFSRHIVAQLLKPFKVPLWVFGVFCFVFWGFFVLFCFFSSPGRVVIKRSSTYHKRATFKYCWRHSSRSALRTSSEEGSS